MKTLLIPALFACVLSLSASKPTKDWQLFSSTEGHFSIKFPGKYDESTQDDKSDNGTTFKIHLATFSPTDDEVYMAGWIDMRNFFPKDVEIKQMLENSRDGATNSMKATTVKTLTTELYDKPYIEFTFEADNFVGKDRIYIK